MSASPTIVAFGDSLTVGYQSPSPEYPDGARTPYGTFLQEMLGEGAKVLIKGVNGETTGGMLTRLEQDVFVHRPSFCVVLGGSNDLGWGLPPDEVAQNIVTLHRRLRHRGIQSVAVTVPSVRGLDDAIPSRRVLNGLISDYCRMEGQPYVDLFSETAEPKTLRLAERYSNDGLHLSTEGYRRFAELLYERVFKSMGRFIGRQANRLTS